MYQALYRKWRPTTFDEVVGQEHITEILKKQVITGRLSHAFLFTGTRGTGKTTCAKILAKAVNCEAPRNGSPCGECAVCRGIDNGSVLDVTEMDAASNNGVDDVRALRDEAVYAPVQAKYRVYIIDEVHMLSKSAFNALLKIMEEPPEHLIFILATTELNKIPPTILSRCQRYSFRRVAAEQIRARLQAVAAAEGIELTDDAAELLSRLADGALRDALSLLDQCAGDKVDTERVRSAIGIAEQDSICALLSALLGKDSDGAVRLLSELYERGKDVGSVLNQLASLCRDLLLCKVAPNSGRRLTGGGFPDTALDEYGAATETGWLMAALDTLQGASAALDRSSDRRLAAELCLVKLCGVSPAPLAAPAEYAAPVKPAPPPRYEPKPAAEPQPVRQAEPAAEPQPTAEPAAAPQPAVQPKAEPQPAAPAEPRTAAVRHTAPAVDPKWEELLNQLSDMDYGLYSMISNPESVVGSCSGGTVTVLYKNEFGESILNGQREMLEQAMGRILGCEAHLNIQAYRDEPAAAGASPAGDPEAPQDPYNGLEQIVTENGYEVIREEK